jgi:hypothetical protein
MKNSMHPPPVETKRVVSKAEYVGIMSRRVTVSFGAFAMLFGGVCGLGATVGLMCTALAVPTIWYFELILLPIAVLFALLIYSGKESLNAVRQEMPVVPLTRHTANELPAENSLVRASSAQRTWEETSLLRPAGEVKTETPEELLRSVS